MSPRSHSTATVVILSLFGLVAASAQTREPASGPGLGAARQAIEQRAQLLEQASRSPQRSAAERAELEREVTVTRRRLTDGDFEPGDRVFVAVEGERALTDTFTVGTGRVLALPTIGDVPLIGVLRSELQAYLRQRVARDLRNPTVHAKAFIRLSIQGAVTHPGYYDVPADARLSEALMAAGGTMQDADVRKLRLERAGQVLWDGGPVQQALAQGRTLDDAGLIGGDQFVVPRRGGTSAGEILRFGAFLLTIPTTVYALTRIF